MTTKDQRRRELARAKLARQDARREAEAHRRKQLAIVASAVAVIAVIGLVTFFMVRDTGSTPAASDTTPTKTKTKTPTSTTTPVAGDCEYRPTDDASTDVTPPPDGPTDVTGEFTANITTNVGDLTLTLDANTAPCTVQSFMTLANQGYFDGTSCHRLTTSHALKVLQCGDPTGTGRGGPGFQFDDETTPDMTYGRGTVAMANAGPNTNGSQFFLVYGDSTLDPNYTVFGSITDGLDVLDDVAEAGVEGGGSDGAPATAVTLESVTVDTAGSTP